MKKIKKGFTLVEILVALGVIAAISVSAFMFYEKVSNSAKVKAEINNIMVMKQVHDQYYLPYESVKDDDYSDPAHMNNFRKEMDMLERYKMAGLIDGSQDIYANQVYMNSSFKSGKTIYADSVGVYRVPMSACNEIISAWNVMLADSNPNPKQTCMSRYGKFQDKENLQMEEGQKNLDEALKNGEISQDIYDEIMSEKPTSGISRKLDYVDIDINFITKEFSVMPTNEELGGGGAIGS